MAPCFNGSATHQGAVGGGRAGVVLQNDDGTIVFLSFRLDFPYSNNVTEYEALVIGLVSTLQMRIENFEYKGTLSSLYNK